MPRGGVVVSNWHTLIDDFNTSSLDFYEAVQEAVNLREVPDVTFDRVTFKEGGLASAKREYLRIERKNVAFDLCGAPFGNSFFFSWWLCRLGPAHPFLYLLGFLAAVFVAPWILAFPFRNSCSYFLVLPIMFVAVIAGLALLARKEVFGPEEHILAIPVLGWIYEKIFNPITYYSLDTALMFQESIRRAVNDVIDGLLDEKGLRALSEDQKRPSIRDLAR